jgi:hypothetical protein
MATGYEPNIVGAIAVLVDLMRANGFTMTREPYEPNYRGLVDAIIDLKEGFPTFAPSRVGFDATTFEAVSDGDALYMRTSDGQVGLAQADGTVDEALVVGFADDDAASGATVKVLVAGLLDGQTGIDAGDIYYLSTTAGEISTSPPTTAGQFVTRVGEGATSTEFSIQLEPPIKLS